MTTSKGNDEARAAQAQEILSKLVNKAPVTDAELKLLQQQVDELTSSAGCAAPIFIRAAEEYYVVTAKTGPEIGVRDVQRWRKLFEEHLPQIDELSASVKKLLGLRSRMLRSTK